MLDGLGMMLATKTTCVAASQPDNFIKVGHRGIDFAKFERFDPRDPVGYPGRRRRSMGSSYGRRLS